MKILHFSDIHARTNHLEEISLCCGFLVDTAMKEEPDLIVYSGDMFDSSEIRLDSPAAKWAIGFFSVLADIAPISVIIGTPSHDGKCAEILRELEAKHEVWVTSGQPEQLILFEHTGFIPLSVIEDDKTNVDCPGKPKAIISAFPQPTKQWFRSSEGIQVTEKQIADGMTSIFADFGETAAKYDCPHILNGHWQVSGAYISGTQVLTGVDIEISTDQMDLGNFDLGCLGHIHKAQEIGQRYFYAGSTQNNTWGELDAKGFWIHEIEWPGDGSTTLNAGFKRSSRFINTPTRQMVDLKLDCTEENFSKWPDWNLVYGLKEQYPYAMDDGTVINLPGARVRLSIKVFVDQYEKLKVPEIKAYFEEIKADLQLEIVRMPRVNVRSAKILDQDTLFDKLKVNADILEENIPEGVREKANVLDDLPGQKIIDVVKAETEKVLRD